MVILFELIHLWFPSRQNLDLTETRVFLRIYHLSAFISELCRPRSYHWFLLECNRKGLDLETVYVTSEDLFVFSFFIRTIGYTRTLQLFFSTVYQTIHYFYCRYVCYEVKLWEFCSYRCFRPVLMSLAAHASGEMLRYSVFMI